jgi:hypothetical protein
VVEFALWKKYYLSREAAKDYSPGRKPWVEVGKKPLPKGRKKLRRRCWNALLPAIHNEIVLELPGGAVEESHACPGCSAAACRRQFT